MRHYLRTVVSVILSVFAISSCNRELEGVETSPKTGYTINFIADIEETKTTMEINGSNVTYSWDTEDEDTEGWFSIWAGDQKASYVVASVNEKGLLSISATFDEQLPASGMIEFTGIMNGIVKDEQISFSDGGPDEKHFYDRESDVLTATASASAAQINDGVYFKFHRVVGVNKMTIKGLPEGANVEEVKITSDNNQLVGTYDLKNGWQDSENNSITITCEEEVESEDEGIVVYFVSRPLTSASLTVDLVDDSGTRYTKTTAAAITLTEGNVKGYTVRVAIDNTDPHLNDDGWFLVKDVNFLKAGDVIRIAQNNNNVVASGRNGGEYLTSVSASFSYDKEEMTGADADVINIVLGGSNGAWTLSYGDEQIVAKCSKKLVDKDSQYAAYFTWPISIDKDGNAIVGPSETTEDNKIVEPGRFLYNVQDPRFLNYTSAPASNMLLPQIYKKYGTPAIVNYEVIIDTNVSGGTIEANPITAAEGQTVTLTATPDATHTFKSWDVIGETSHQTIAVSSDNTFSMPEENVLVSAVFEVKQTHTLTNEEIVNVVSKAGGSAGYKDVTITNAYGDWTANAYCASTQPYLQIRGKSGSQLTSPLFEQSIKKVVVHMNSSSNQIRTLAAIVPDFDLPTDYSDTNISNSSRYSTGKTTGVEEDVTLQFAKVTKQFTLVAIGGAVYIDYIDVEFGDIPTVAVTGVTVSPATAEIYPSETVQLQATIAPSDATNTNVTWSSNAEGIATVDNHGVVTGVSAGTAVIKATTEDGGFGATATITVKDALPVGTGIADIYKAVTSTSNSQPSDFATTLTDAVVTYKGVLYGSNSYVYMEDSQRGVLLYRCGAELEVGDVLSGQVTGSGYKFGGLTQVSSIDLSHATKGHTSVIPEHTLSVSELNANFERYYSCRVKLENVDVDASTDSKTIAGISVKEYTVALSSGTAESAIVYPSTFNGNQLSVWELPVYKSSGDDDSEKYSFTSFTQANEVTLNASNFTITLQKNTGSTAPQWNGNSNEARVYAKGSVVITSSREIKKIVYEYVFNEGGSSKVIPTIESVQGSEDAGTWTESTKTWKGSDKTVTLSTNGSAGNIGFKSITVYFVESDDEPIPLEVPINLSWNTTTKTLSWEDTNASKCSHNADYKYQYRLGTTGSWEDATSATTAVLSSLTATTTVYVRAFAINTTDYSNSAETANFECTVSGGGVTTVVGLPTAFSLTSGNSNSINGNDQNTQATLKPYNASGENINVTGFGAGFAYSNVPKNAYYLITLPNVSIPANYKVTLGMSAVKTSNNKYIAKFKTAYSLNGTDFIDFGSEITETTTANKKTADFIPSEVNNQTIYIKIYYTQGSTGGNHYLGTVSVSAAENN